MKKAFIAMIVVAAWASGSVSQRTYTAEQIANLTFNDVTRVIRSVLLPATVIQTNNRQYSLDMIFNLVYDSTNRALRISGTVTAAPPDSAHEWAHAWMDTAYAKVLASKAGLSLQFYMRGKRGDTLFKFIDRHGNVPAWGDTVGSSWWLGRVTARADSADTASYSRLKLIGQKDSIPWCTSINSWGAKGFITGWYADSPAVRPPEFGTWYTGVALREKRYGGLPAGPAREIWSIRVGGYKTPIDSTREAWRYPMAVVDPGNVQPSFTKGIQRVYWGTPFYFFRIDTVCTLDSVAWVDTSGQVHCRGVDLFPQGSAPTDSFKLWASSESLWYNDKAGAPHGIWPSSGGPGSGSAFGDTNAYFVSKGFGPGYDSIAGHYFNTIQGALDAATAANDSVHFKTVYILPGYYHEPCSLRNFVSMRGLGGKGNTRLVFDLANKFTSAGARKYVVNDMTIVDSVGNQPCSLSSRGVSYAHYDNVDFITSKNATDIPVRFALSSGDTLIIEDCDIGKSTQNGAVAFRGTVTGLDSNAYFFMKNSRVMTTSGSQTAMLITTFATANVSIYHSTVQSPNGIGAQFINNGFFDGYFYFSDCSFTGQTNAIFFTANPAASMVMQNVSCFGIVTGPASSTMIPIGMTVTDNTGENGPIGGLMSFSGPVVWRDANGRGWFFGAVSYDTTYAKPSPAHNGMSFYRKNASPDDTLYIYMNADWRNLDRTWASGTDSVLANGTSDTVAVTGLHAGMFVEVQIESDPGTNIGKEFHTITTNQDIITWPAPCVNKFYYRWRIH